MKNNIVAAFIVALGLVTAAFVNSGRYYALVANQNTVVTVDRWTGRTDQINTSTDPFNDPVFKRHNSR